MSAPSLEAADTLVLCVPLYADGLPAQVVRMMERMERAYRGAAERHPAARAVPEAGTASERIRPYANK